LRNFSAVVLKSRLERSSTIHLHTRDYNNTFSEHGAYGTFRISDRKVDC
jgi:hypothetical protein